MSGIGITGLILLLIVALLLFGPSKLPELGRAFGRTLREFRKGASELLEDGEDRKKRTPPSEWAAKTSSDAAPADGDDRREERRLPE
ncbi:MAG TPA: twin-arginine translocase TatA/TatE family subunit [Paenibacillaceae bacterium]